MVQEVPLQPILEGPQPGVGLVLPRLQEDQQAATSGGGEAGDGALAVPSICEVL